MDWLLEKINSPEDLRNLDQAELPVLAGEIREFILDTLSVKPGHLGASLGVVEITLALHYFYQTPEDQLIWDVGHQCYPHKIITGRKKDFGTLRQLHGISGFPSIKESQFDAFGTGHSSTSISAITGMAIADRLLGKSNRHIVVIGDASIVSGMALEGLNHLGSTDLDVLIVLNDNSIGIDPSVGALKDHFFELEKGLSHSVFEDFGFHYKGVIDGHDFSSIFSALEELESIHNPKVLHIKTVKGKGYPKAEADQVKWHSPGLFNKETGEISNLGSKKISYQTVFGETLTKLMRFQENIVAITPAMLTGSNLVKTKLEFPDRVLDIGIAEQHAVTLAAGMAKQGVIPYLAVYSTFLQRAYDQVIHDVALQNLPVIFCIDRAGIVGTDGATHHGYFDTTFLRAIPNMTVSAPMNEKDFQNLLFTAKFVESPMSIRFPKGNTEVESLDMNFEKIEIGKAEELKSGNEIALLSFGTIGNKIQKILRELNSEKFGHYKFLFVKPLDKEMLSSVFERYPILITFEDGILTGGFGEAVREFAQELEYKGKIICKGYPDEFIEHASVEELEALMGLDENSLRELINGFL